MLLYLVVSRALVESEQQHARVGRNHRSFVVGSGKFADRVQRVERHDGHEFHRVVQVSAQEVDAAKPGNLSLDDPLQNVAPQQCLVGIGVGWRGPAMPNAVNHYLDPAIDLKIAEQDTVLPLSLLHNHQQLPVDRSRSAGVTNLLSHEVRGAVQGATVNSEQGK